MSGFEFFGNAMAWKRLLSRETRPTFQPVFLYGEKGVGRRTFANMLAARYLAGEENYHMEGFFDSEFFSQVRRGAHPDLVILDNTENISKIEEVRELSRKAGMKANQGARKVFLLLEADRLSIQGQNALLKLLEDPPADTALILTGTGKHGLLETLLSRLISVPLFPVSQDELSQALQKKLEEAPAEDIVSLYEKFAGNIGKTLTYLSGEENAYTEVEDFVPLVIAQDFYGILVALEVYKKNRAGFYAFCEELLIVYEEAGSGALARNTLAGELSRALDFKLLLSGLSGLRDTLSRKVLNTNLILEFLTLAFGLVKEEE